jgi:hypothetical protein
MTARDHFEALRGHGVRIDAALYDPGAQLRLDSELLAREGVRPIAWRLSAPRSGAHHSRLLGVALRKLLLERDGLEAQESLLSPPARRAYLSPGA